MRKSENSLTRKFVVHGNYMHNLRYSNGLWSRRELSDNYMFFNANYQLQGDFSRLIWGQEPLLLRSYWEWQRRVTSIRYTSPPSCWAPLKACRFIMFTIYSLEVENGSWSHELSLIYIIQKKERFLSHHLLVRRSE